MGIIARGANQFLQVLHAHFALFAFFVLVVFQQAAGVEHDFHLIGQGRARGLRRQALDEIEKRLECIGRTPRQLGFI